MSFNSGCLEAFQVYLKGRILRLKSEDGFCCEYFVD
jgi:hypothetical protein